MSEMPRTLNPARSANASCDRPANNRWWRRSAANSWVDFNVTREQRPNAARSIPSPTGALKRTPLGLRIDSVTGSDLDAIGLLQDAARRSLYAYVVAQGREVSRNEAAEAVGLQRTLAAFHLDRLATAGLLDVSYRRLSERTGPGAGRPAKLYRRAATDHTVSLPPRDYLLVGKILAEAIERSGAEETLYGTAREQGAAAGRALARSSGLTLDDLRRDLAERGYEPYQDGSRLRLRNCPFHAVAQEFPVVACGMNLALLEGMLSGGGLDGAYVARLDPRPGECCVALHSKNNVH